MSALEVERVWIVGCSRCASEGTAYEDTEGGAIADLLARGWTREGFRQFCPSCNRELK